MKASVIVAAFLAGLICGVAMSGRTADWAVATIGSHHLNDKDYCEFNPGVGGEWRWSENMDLLGGFYSPNSLCERATIYGGVLRNFARAGRWEAGVAALGLTGYNSSLTLGVALAISYEGTRHGVNLVWFPSKKGDFTQGVLALQYKRRF